MTDEQNGINTRIAVLEVKVEQIKDKFEMLDAKNAASYANISSKIDTVHTDMGRLQRYINEKHEAIQGKIDNNISAINNQHLKVLEKINTIEKWRWLVTGGAVVIGYLISELKLLNRPLLKDAILTWDTTLIKNIFLTLVSV